MTCLELLNISLHKMLILHNDYRIFHSLVVNIHLGDDHIKKTYLINTPLI